MSTFIKWFNELSLQDVAVVGGKTASLGEMFQALRPLGVRVPDGFAITAAGYWALLDQTGLRARIAALLSGLDKTNLDELARRGKAVRALILAAELPQALWAEIEAAYATLAIEATAAGAVAVRSSATAEDLPTASFAGQQETFLNVRGLPALRQAISGCFASLFTDRAISYRMDRGFGHLDVALSIAVQKMVRADLAASGVMFTLDTETGFREAILIEGAWGLGENVVQGAVDPDEFCVFKPTLRTGKRPILRRRVGAKQLRMVYGASGSGTRTCNEPVPEPERRRLCLSDEEVLTLARWALGIEDYYSQRAGHGCPMDIEWAKDGPSGELYIVQARPETVESQHAALSYESFTLTRKGPVLATGRSVGRKVAVGPVRVVRSPAELSQVAAGEVLVVETTTPDWEPVMKRAAAIVTDRGGRTCHAAIVARELGIPAVVGTGDGTRKLRDGTLVTVSCAGGETGLVYDGALPFRIQKQALGELPATRTQIQMNVGDPAQAFALAALPNDGVGLARMEFIITSAIRVHPMALLHPERVEPPAWSAIEALTAGYADKPAFFVDRLAEGIATIAAAFYPKPVIVRLSDFKSNEYESLLGGRAFELKEDNPMIGLRGAARYTHPSYAEAFALECRALQRVREEMGLTNVRVMVPFCRRVEEGERVLAAMAEHGLRRGADGLEVYVMCEIPNNVLRIDEFCRIFDGISIGSNDLTQLTLGVDRDSELVAFDFDERDPGVLKMLRLAVEGARRNHRHVGICGQAPSDYPEMAAYLVQLGIDSISLNPDTLISTRLHIAQVEKWQGPGGVAGEPATPLPAADSGGRRRNSLEAGSAPAAAPRLGREPRSV